jgi:SpoVK/Ycf46/Vps4 family AAA+-type ATPase
VLRAVWRNAAVEDDMARGELMKKLLASYGRDEEFRAVAEQIIDEEEQKRNRVLARTLRRTLDNAVLNATSSDSTESNAVEGLQPDAPRSLAPLLPFPDPASEYVERKEPTHTLSDIALTEDNREVIRSLTLEFRKGDEIRSRGLSRRSKLLFCGPPGCGKTLCAEVFAQEVGLPLLQVKLDRLISSYLGETATNIRKLFELARKQSCVLFLDEFDAIARTREDTSEHSELRRVVNSLLLFIDRMEPRGFLIAATNLDASLDPAVWRRFDEVMWFDKPNRKAIADFIGMKFRNVERAFRTEPHLKALQGYSYADVQRVCTQAMRTAIVERREVVSRSDFVAAIGNEMRRHRGSKVQR